MEFFSSLINFGVILMPGINQSILVDLRNNNPALNKLDLSNLQLTDKDISELASALNNNTNLTALTLDNNQIGDYGASLLLKNKQLTHLSILGNKLNDSTLQTINNEIRQNILARRLLIVEQAIIVAQGSTQNACGISRLPMDVLQLILVIVAVDQLYNNSDRRSNLLMMQLILANVRTKNDTGLRTWNKVIVQDGIKHTFFRTWIPPQEYMSRVIRYTSNCYQLLEDIPDIKNLITRPFMLKIIREIMPQLMNLTRNDIAAGARKKVTKAKLYDLFVGKRFDDYEANLRGQGQFRTGEDIKAAFWQYAQELAQTMHKFGVKDKQMIIVGQSINDPWARFFDRTNPRLQILQIACMVKEFKSNQYAFIDYSLYEYFFSRSIYQNIIGDSRPRRLTVT